MSVSSPNVPVINIPDDLRQSDRVIKLLRLHYSKYDTKPAFLVRVPGRVNLIGEHIDYCGYSVFPMALKQDIIMAVSLNNFGKINLTNMERGEYSDFNCDVHALEFAKPAKWYHYFQCGYKGVTEKYCAGGNDTLPGIDVTVHGTIPPSAGLSSSSAMVCASAFATIIALYQKLDRLSTPIPKLDLANLTIKSERYVGTDSGGMDQAIAIFAEEGSAKIIDFIPQLNTTNVKLPEGVNFYISHSGVSMNKAATAYYNIRVAETRLAAAIIARKLDIKGYKLGDQLWVVQQASAVPLSDMGDSLRNIFDVSKPFYTKSEICAIIGEEEADLDRIFLSRVSEPMHEFKVYQRALHVYEEANRVQKFRKICESSGEVLKLGQLMTESHESCKNLYECSHPKLDELVAVAMSAGALGSRLTGAGWGGCIVSLVPEELSELFEAEIAKHSKFNCKSRPSGGSIIYKL